ncbi:pilin [Patescibacteria group bacterium]|nr:pilin [Patescibacteria group bacterium]
MFKTARFIFSFIFSLLSFYFLFSTPLLAQTTKDWTGRCVATFDNEVATIQGLECLFYNILQIITFIAGLVFFFMFIANGFKYIFSSSDQKQLATIQASLTMTILGVIGVIASWLILRLIENFTGLKVTEFRIPG